MKLSTVLPSLLLSATIATAHAERVYISSNHVRVIDTETRALAATIDLGESYVRDMAFHPDGRTAYVAHSRGIAVVDVASSTVRETWSDRPVNDLQVRPDENALYTLQHTEGGPYEVAVYALDGGEELRRWTVDQKALDLVAPPAVDRVYTTNLHRSQLSAFDRATGTEGAVVPVQSVLSDAEGAQTYISESILSRDGQSIYVVMNGARAGVSIYDAATGEHRRDVILGHPAYVRDAALAPDGTRLYLAAIDHLSVVDLTAGTEIAWLPLEAPHQGIAVSADGARLYLANPVTPGPAPAGGSIAVIDAERLEIVDRIPVDGISPFKVAAVP